jgi:hypothetical protein
MLALAVASAWVVVAIFLTSGLVWAVKVSTIRHRETAAQRIVRQLTLRALINMDASYARRMHRLVLVFLRYWDDRGLSKEISSANTAVRFSIRKLKRMMALWETAGGFLLAGTTVLVATSQILPSEAVALRGEQVATVSILTSDNATETWLYSGSAVIRRVQKSVIVFEQPCDTMSDSWSHASVISLLLPRDVHELACP